MLKIKVQKLKYLFVDFENVHHINVEKIKKDNVNIYVLVGRLQNNLPFTLIRKTQELGDRLKWIKIASDGKNNLDFHLTFLLGKYHEKLSKDIPFFILSKDKGYDGVIKYINYKGRKCYRIESI